ncbi:MAG: transposase [Bacteroidota bacterium]|nr:transposase [Bacteroidota bacterium]
MPFTNVYLHYIWATKAREPIISSDLKPLLLDHIQSNSKSKEIFIDTLNCMSDHIHVLVSLGRDQTISKVSQLIKGESSFWINRQGIIKSKFEWQDEYAALSVSQSALPKVRDYIKNQEAHHKKHTFQQEYDGFISRCGFRPENFG